MSQASERRAKMLGKTMKESWEALCNEYLRLFCEKHGFEYDPNDWVGGKEGIGTVCCLSDYWLDLETIRFDIDNAIPAEKFFEYEDYDSKIRDIELSFDLLYNPPREEGRMIHINYRSFCKGCPRPYTDEKLREMQEGLDYQKQLRDNYIKELTELQGSKEDDEH